MHLSLGDESRWPEKPTPSGVSGPQGELTLPLAASPWSGAGKTKTLTAKSTATAVAQRGRGFFREAPRRERKPRKARIRQTGATPQPDFPNYTNWSSGAQHRDANSHQLEDRRLPPNLPPNEETSPLAEVQPFMKRIHFRFRGTCRILSVLLLKRFIERFLCLDWLFDTPFSYRLISATAKWQDRTPSGDAIPGKNFDLDKSL